MVIRLPTSTRSECHGWRADTYPTGSVVNATSIGAVGAIGSTSHTSSPSRCFSGRVIRPRSMEEMFVSGILGYRPPFVALREFNLPRICHCPSRLRRAPHSLFLVHGRCSGVSDDANVETCMPDNAHSLHRLQWATVCRSVVTHGEDPGTVSTIVIDSVQ